MKVLVLTDLKIGSSKQAIALGKELSDDVMIYNVKYNSFIKIPNIIRFGLLGVVVNKEEIADLLAYKPEIIIFSGRRLSKFALYLKANLDNKPKIITITNPEVNFKDFYKVILPYHDKDIEDKYNNILRIDGSLCKFDKEFMKKEGEDFLNTFGVRNTKFISLFIGGNTKNKTFDKLAFGEFIQELSNLVRKNNATLLISTSRRTTEDQKSVLINNLFCNHYLYDWEKARKDKSIKNPYNAFFELSDTLVMTGDSISMISEAITFGKSLYIYRDDKQLTKKHINFINSVVEKNIAKIFTKDLKGFEKINTRGFDELKRIKNILLENINK